MQSLEQKMLELAKTVWQPEKLLLAMTVVGRRRPVLERPVVGRRRLGPVMIAVGQMRRLLERKMPALVRTVGEPGTLGPVTTLA